MVRQPLENQTLYAELLEQMQTLESLRSIGALEGSFVKKSLKCEDYVYFQYYDPGGIKRQIYVGKKTAVLDALVEKYRIRTKDFRSRYGPYPTSLRSTSCR